ncbi:CDK5 regulatory subunit-associated protein 2 isoform X2 [Echinops telfairi]|uniref:CDK5 regulatory subunit-associated protein 2 isoform X2 n=1 Tax=Echinops telfairi TaxID=9371 RepID=A0AC55DL69_ECHTE|nr:CDK5 regulatory subunit-associated protein 2 isoform X2 [Echinops telfairi]
MKDFENQITELKKENFNLKLRIYFLEERMQQEFDGPMEHVYKTNIELKVEVESLKRELQEREQLLIKASKVVESLAEGGSSEIQRVKEEAQKKVQQVEDRLTKRILLLEEDVKAAQAELETAFTGAEKEKALRASLETKLSEMETTHAGDGKMALALQEKERLIEELKLSLKSKEALIQRLKEEESRMASADDSVASGERRGRPAAPQEERERETQAVHMEWQKKRNCFEERIQALQEDLREKEREIATEKKNSLKRDKAIQGLTMALKSKEKEIKELNSEMDALKAAVANTREASQKSQAPEAYEAALSEKEALLAELRSENLTKSTENHRLCRSMKQLTQELSDLQQAKETLEKDLEEARREKSKDDRSGLDLRNQVEKLHDDLKGREKAMENRYKSLLIESNKKVHSQEQEIKRLTESVNQKDSLLMKFNEKDLEAIQHNCHLRTAEDLQFKSEGFITERCSSHQPPGSKIIFVEEKQQSDYEELTQALEKEQAIYSRLVKSLPDSDSPNILQAELSHIRALRRQLEQEVLSYRTLQRTLEEQIKAIRRREEEAFSFYSDQTSYLSICLEEHSRLQVEHFSQEELKKKVSDLVQLVKELYTDNQHLKKTIFELSCVSVQGSDRLESADQLELLGRKEDEDTVTTGADGRKHFLSDCQPLEQSKEIAEDTSKGGCSNGYLQHRACSLLESGGTCEPVFPGAQHREEGALLDLLAPFLHEKATLLLESRPDLLQTLRELLLEQIHMTEQELSGEFLDGKAKETLKQMAIQLRGELRHFFEASSLSKPHDELQSPWGAKPVKVGKASMVELKDASVQTVVTEGDTVRFRHEGVDAAWEDKPTDAVHSTEPQPENLHHVPGRKCPARSLPSGTKREAKKSRLPILMKPSRPPGSAYQLAATPGVEAQLQGRVMELQRELQEFKTANKQLHQKLLLAEAMMEGSPPLDRLLSAQPLVGASYQGGSGEQEEGHTAPGVWRDKETDNDLQTSYDTDSEIYQPDDLAFLPTCKENPSEDFLGTTSVATGISSKSQLSVKVSVIETDPSESNDAENDTEYLKQKIRDLETELRGYQNFLFRLQSGKHSQCSEAVITVLCGTEGAQESMNKSKGNTDDEEMTFSSLHQVRYVKHMKILHPVAPDMVDGRMLENLRQQLVEQEYELQKGQNLNLELFSDIHNLQNKFRDLSPSRYDSLVQSQARELSLHRQQMKDSHGVCVTCRQLVSTMRKALEEFLHTSDVDYSLAEGFRQQLNRCAELLEKLEKLCLNGKSTEVEVCTQNELIDRPAEDAITYQHILPESPEPSASRALSDCDGSEKSSFFSRDQKQDSETEKISGLVNHFSQDSLMEHIQEIRTLRKRLEDSIKTNEKLRKQLERQGSEFDQDKQKENETLRESLSRKTASLEHLQQEHARVQAENERLQKEAGEQERRREQLVQEIYTSRSQLRRAQEEVKVRQQLLSQNDELLQSLRMELKVYEKLDEEHRRPREARAEASGEGWRGQGPFGDLHGLLGEIQMLRAHLERSIDTNRSLQSKLEEQLAQGGNRCPVLNEEPNDLFDPTLAAPPKSASETLLLYGDDVDSLSCDSGSLVTGSPCMPHPVPGHHLWANKSGCHVLGLIEDYNALRKQISWGQRLLAEMDIQIQEAPGPTVQELATKGPHSAPLSRFITSVDTAKCILGEASRLLKLFWRVSLPTHGQCTHHCEQVGDMKAEITKLEHKLYDQDQKLQSTVKLLQLSKHQEKAIFDQLVVTHSILRKARGNLELRPGAVHPGTASPGRPGS